MKVAFAPAAKADLFAATDYYDKRKKGLGGEFLDAVSKALSDIKEAPARLALQKHGVRKWGLSRFPYAIVLSHPR